MVCIYHVFQPATSAEGTYKKLAWTLQLGAGGRAAVSHCDVLTKD